MMAGAHRPMPTGCRLVAGLCAASRWQEDRSAGVFVLAQRFEIDVPERRQRGMELGLQRRREIVVKLLHRVAVERPFQFLDAGLKPGHPLDAVLAYVLVEINLGITPRPGNLFRFPAVAGAGNMHFIPG